MLLDRRVRREVRGVARGVERVAEAAHLVDELVLERLLARPHAALTDGVDLLLRHVAALRHAVEEHVVELLHLVAQLDALVVGEAAVERLGVGARRRLADLDVDADLAEQLAHVGLAVEDADRAGDGQRQREDLLGGRRDVVAAARRDRAHRDDERLLLGELLQLAPHHVRGHRRAAGALDAEHDGLDVVVVPERLDRLGDRVRADELHAEERHGLRAAVDDVAVDVEEADARRGCRSASARRFSWLYFW